jgi:hypothetical protein
MSNPKSKAAYLQMHLVAERFIVWGPLSGFLKDGVRPIQWIQCHLLPRHLFSVFTFISLAFERWSENLMLSNNMRQGVSHVNQNKYSDGDKLMLQCSFRLRDRRAAVVLSTRFPRIPVRLCIVPCYHYVVESPLAQPASQ